MYFYILIITQYPHFEQCALSFLFRCQKSITIYFYIRSCYRQITLHYVHIQNNDSNCDCLKNEQVAKYKLWHIVASTLYNITSESQQNLYCNASVQDTSKQCVRAKNTELLYFTLSSPISISFFPIFLKGDAIPMARTTDR